MVATSTFEPRKIAQQQFDFVRFLAQSHHQSGFRKDVRPVLLAELQNIQRLPVIRLRDAPSGTAAESFPCCD
jgi:hypothetical protein